jgi:MFS family permease
MFSSLAIRNYRIYFIGALFANTGQWLARTAQSWLVLTVLTNNSATALGYATALQFIPTLVLTPFTGPTADRFPKRNIIRLAMGVFLIDAAILSTLVITGHAQLWHVYMFACIDGVASAFYSPAQQSFVSEVVPIGKLPNAISLNSASFNMARLIGPGLAGVLIAIFSTGPVMAINVVTFGIMLTALTLMRKDELNPAPRAKGSGQLKAGLRYVWHRKDLLVLLGCGLAVGGLGFNFNISNAVMATAAFGRGSTEFGALGSLMGIGALAAALLSAARKLPRLRQVLMGMAGYVVFSFFAGISPNYWIFAILQVPIGLFTITTLVVGNSMVQTRTAPEMRGRVMALWNLVIMGVTPVISPLVGILGDVIGPRSTVQFGVIAVAICLVLIVAYVMHHHSLRVRFLEMDGIIPRFRLEYGIDHDIDTRSR